MAEKLLKVGDYVELRQVSPVQNAYYDDGVPSCRITELNDENAITISMPMINGISSPIEIGDRFEVTFVASQGSYECKAQVTEDNGYGMGSGYELKLLSEINKNRKRKFFRLDKIIPMEYSIRDGNVLKDKIPATGFNISGGGMRFSSEINLERDDIILISILLDDYDEHETELTGRVIYTEKSENDSSRFEHRVEFVDVDFETKEKLVRFCFREACKQ